MSSSRGNAVREWW